ncbi:glycerophosphodiester phosphodiesterase family protein [Saccharospirillum mangrovi]|uniref:glycerophosphodiester phosphodiesterase family protein n=1 Tax=Saccharospirillum mangrovi TaxID=2161747 RepID=UPI000D3AF0C6|nr:glycerophosphodiester phosphodiesterase family protein [Saccharospirillum mangrovi]
MARESLRFALPQRLPERPLCIAHRGASSYAPDNTLQAFRFAAELGADYWEVDVRLTRDAQPVASHGAEVDEHLGSGVIATLDWAQLQQAAPELPSLDAVIDLAEQLGQGLYIELKDAGSGAVVLERLLARGFAQAVLGSFKASEIRALAEQQCPYPLSILVPVGADPFVAVADSGADIMHLCWENASDHPQTLVTDDLLQRARQAGLAVVLWHEERRSVLQAIMALPVLGICTNSPEMMNPLTPVQALGIQIVCHRGANYFAPENTLAAARLVLEQGADYLELDVRESADGELVVMHDATVDRTTNGSGRVDELTLAQLSELDAGAWFSPRYRGERVPTLAQMIALCQFYNKQMYIEIKAADPARVIALVEAMGFQQQCFFWSGDARLQAEVRAVSDTARIKSTAADYSDMALLQAHLNPEIAEFELYNYARQLADCTALGITPMLKYFGEDPAMFDTILALRPALLNIDRSDLLLARYRQGKLASS